MSKSPTTAQWSSDTLDTILSAQLLVAWAGEGGEEPRLGWWRTELASEFGGEDLFRRLLPGSWRWATLQAVREAARRRDAEFRGQHHDADQIHSLFHFGFELDEKLDERLQEHKRATLAPPEALPQLALTAAEWDRDAFDAWLRSHDAASSSQTPVGRRIKGAPPAQPVARVSHLVAALAPLGEAYPLPHYHLSRADT